MDLNELITICVFYTIIGVDLVSSLATFGSEHVHIKVIIPEDVSSAKWILKHKHPVIHHVPEYHVRHKIIHHYHPKPIKKPAPVLESIYLAELDKAYHNQKHIYQHNNDGEEYELQPHEEYNINNKKTKNINKNVIKHRARYNQRVETVKFVEEKPQYHYQPKKHVEYDYQIPKGEVLNIIQSPKYARYEPQVEEFVEENNHEYIYPHSETEIVKTKPTVSNKYYKSYDPEYPLLHGVSEKSLEGNQAKNHNYENDYQIYYGFQQPMKQKEKQEYHHYQKAPETKYNSSQKPDDSIDSQQYATHTSTVHKPSHHYEEHTMAETDLSTNNARDEPTYNSELTYEADFQKYLPSSESPPENSHATKTYTGFDSYSTGHVQGVGSGGYRYDMS